jgi:hypothetical protein
MSIKYLFFRTFHRPEPVRGQSSQIFEVRFSTQRSACLGDIRRRYPCFESKQPQATFALFCAAWNSAKPIAANGKKLVIQILHQ